MARKHGEKVIEKARKAERTPTRKDDNVPGLSPNPATNLLIADVAMRAGSYLMRRTVQKTMLQGRYGKFGAMKIVEGEGLGTKLAAIAIAKMATRSLPGAVVVGGGILAKTLYDRSANVRAKRKGDRNLAEQAEDSDSPLTGAP